MEYNGAVVHTQSKQYRQLRSTSVGRFKNVNVIRASIYPLIFLVLTGLVLSISRTFLLISAPCLICFVRVMINENEVFELEFYLCVRVVD